MRMGGIRFRPNDDDVGAIIIAPVRSRSAFYDARLRRHMRKRLQQKKEVEEEMWDDGRGEEKAFLFCVYVNTSPRKCW